MFWASLFNSARPSCIAEAERVFLFCFCILNWSIILDPDGLPFLGSRATTPALAIALRWHLANSCAPTTTTTTLSTTMAAFKSRSSGAAGSAAASTSATPAPASLAETLSFHNAPRTFKSAEFSARMAKMSSNLARRNKSLKQMLQSEREAAMRAAGAKFKQRKKKDVQNKRLVGAALQAVARREERERAAKTEPEKEPTPTPEEDTPKEDALKEEEEDEEGKREVPTYSSVEAPPSLRPAKKYCDVTGLVAPYTDPKSTLRYHSVEVYEIIKQFGPGVDNAYLSLRGDASQIK